ncbi:uncharacterized protein EI97DRAFT_494765 [Westerdykella ornata]|uniref:Dynactin subunit 4 n=1 Tax=Westerdykella ornata TaxID=318751 RepID=A0A6A6JG47_WESOR|nr:uncharacterized protein EI97DRAFT_494765 [Westerdykella ornata]KAF2275521.1 hypothetical protein EI97DRAFT_494765 [Westerdykella ornata]
MAYTFPYTYYSCSCHETRISPGASKRSSHPPPAEDEEDEQTFDPKNPRSNYSLYPLEHLLYCEDCRQIRCPRCVIEETLNWFCPSCLFEVPSSVVKSDGNRCTRNCYNCPVCSAPMPVASLEDPANPSPNGGPFILSCPYCHWSTAEIGIEFDKPTGITSQLARIANGGNPMPTQKDKDKERDRRKESESRKLQDLLLSGTSSSSAADSSAASTSFDDIYASTSGPTHDDLFSNLSAFYKSQLALQTPSNPFSPHMDLNFASPSSFSRIMNLYSSTVSKKQKRDKPVPMREAASALEGLRIHSPSTDVDTIERLRKEGWNASVSPAQRLAQPNPNVRLASELRPVATLLCTKRGKRCATCRHILSKPEAKITSTRYKIKLLALNHVPRISVRWLSPTPAAASTTTINSTSSSFGSGMPNPASVGAPSAAAGTFDYENIKPGIPTHFILHVSNPLFDPIRVTLATPSITPGKLQSRVTLLCPQFEVGANTDVWDDALGGGGRKGSVSVGAGGGDGQIEAGKVWDRGRNWTSVVMEIVPGLGVTGSGAGDDDDNDNDDEELDEDDAVLEIPIFVRIEYETEVGAEEGRIGMGPGERGGKGGEAQQVQREKREEAFWTVVGVGRVLLF